jgi:S1-C subfamily serine protease
MAGVWLAVSVAAPGNGTASDDPAALNTVASAPPRDDTWTEPLAAGLASSLPTIKVMGDGTSTTGAGVVLDTSGHVLTSAGPVAGADMIFVIGPDGIRSRATVIAVDTVTDLAVLHADGGDLEPAPFSLARRVRVGQYALARTPGGDTSPDGRVVALTTSVAGPTGSMLHGVIAFSAPESAPVPGAGIFDDTGEVFAITTSAKAVSASRMGHAVPAALAVEIANQLISSGAASHPWLGIQGQDLGPDKALVLGTAGGAVITSVTPRGPADRAGMLVGDAVVSANGRSVSSMADLVVVLREVGSGETVNLSAVRGGSVVILSARLAER